MGLHEFKVSALHHAWLLWLLEPTLVHLAHVLGVVVLGTHGELGVGPLLLFLLFRVEESGVEALDSIGVVL